MEMVSSPGYDEKIIFVGFFYSSIVIFQREEQSVIFVLHLFWIFYCIKMFESQNQRGDAESDEEQSFRPIGG